MSEQEKISMAPTAEEALQIIQEQNGFQLKPYEGVLDLGDKSRFAKLELTSAQKIHISGLLQQAPAAATAGAMTQLYSVQFPEGLPETLTALTQGGFGSQIREGGKFVGSASFYPVTTQAAVLGAFTVMSIASSQYFLAQINNELGMMKMKLDKILEFLYGDKKAELMSEVSFTKYAYQNYTSIMAHEPQRIATITGLQGSKKVAMKDIEFYIADLDATVNSEAKGNYSNLDELAIKTFQIGESLEIAQQLYLMSSLLEMYFAQNHDKEYIQALESDLTAYLDKCDRRMLSSFSIMNSRIAGYKQKPMEKIDKTINEKKFSTLIDSLNSGEESPMRKSMRTALHASTQPTEYYLSQDGNVYYKHN